MTDSLSCTRTADWVADKWGTELAAHLTSHGFSGNFWPMWGQGLAAMEEYVEWQ